MTPELMEAGGGSPRAACSSWRIDNAGKPVFNQGVALYVDELQASAFDGFQALGGLSLTVGVWGSCAASSAPTARGRPRSWTASPARRGPTAGKLYFGSNLNLREMNEPQIAQAGIGRKFQKPTVFEALTRAGEPRTRA